MKEAQQPASCISNDGLVAYSSVLPRASSSSYLDRKSPAIGNFSYHHPLRKHRQTVKQSKKYEHKNLLPTARAFLFEKVMGVEGERLFGFKFREKRHGEFRTKHFGEYISRKSSQGYTFRETHLRDFH